MNSYYKKIIVETNVVEFFRDGEKHQVVLDDTNHLMHVKPQRFIDFTEHKVSLVAHTTENTVVDMIVPTGKKMVYVSTISELVYWENFEEHEARERAISGFGDTEIVAYERGYIMGTMSPYGGVKGLMSASKTSGYEFWQKVYTLKVAGI